jgi:RimJ/RimL family protein N-acetyltransferase
MDVRLREVRDADVAVFYEYQADPVASVLAAVPSRDRAAHAAHWARIRADPQVVIRAVVVDGAVAGQVLSFPRDGVRELGYWLGREFWGRGVAGTAVAAFLPVVTERPLYAVVAEHNAASRRLLERLGFVAVGRREPVPGPGGGAPVVPLVLRLD